MDKRDPTNREKARTYVCWGTLTGLFTGFCVFLFLLFWTRDSEFGQLVAGAISFFIAIFLGILGAISGFFYFGYRRHHENDEIDFNIPPDMR